MSDSFCDSWTVVCQVLLSVTIPRKEYWCGLSFPTSRYYPDLRLWCWEGLGAGGEGDDRGWDGWMASLTRWTWVWVNSRSGDGQGGLACCDSWGCRVGHDWATELNWGIKAASSALAGRFFTTKPPGKPKWEHVEWKGHYNLVPFPSFAILSSFWSHCLITPLIFSYFPSPLYLQMLCPLLV